MADENYRSVPDLTEMPSPYENLSEQSYALMPSPYTGAGGMEQYQNPDPSQMASPLGLASSGPSSLGLAPSQMNESQMIDQIRSQIPYDPIGEARMGGEQAAAYYEALPWWVKSNMSTGRGGVGVPDFAQHRQMQAYRLAQLEEQKRQHDIGLFEKAMAHPQSKLMLEQLGKTPNYSLSSQARMMSRALNEKDYGAIEAYKEIIPVEVQKRFLDGTLSQGELDEHLSAAREAHRFNVKEQAKTAYLQAAMSKPEDKQTPHEKEMIRQHREAIAKTEAETFAKQAGAIKDLSIAELNRKGGRTQPDRSTLNKIHQTVSGGLSWEQGTEETQNESLDRYYQGFAQGRERVQARTPIGQTGKAQEWRDPVTGKAAPAWMTPEDLQRIGAVNIEPGQANTIAQATTVDQLLSEILTSGSTLTRKEVGTALMDIPAGMAQTPINKLIKKYAGNPDAAVLQSALTRLGPVLGRMAGDTHISNIDQASYKEAAFSDADTVESLRAKIKSIYETQSRVKQAMGFFPDDKSYLRSLVIRGLPDEQIKAIMQERKRMQ